MDTQSNLDAYVEKYAKYAEIAKYTKYSKYTEYARFAEYAKYALGGKRQHFEEGLPIK